MDDPGLTTIGQALRGFLAESDTDEVEVTHEEGKRLQGAVATALLELNTQRERGIPADVASTMHVHDVAHEPRITTEPLGILDAPLAKTGKAVRFAGAASLVPGDELHFTDESRTVAAVVFDDADLIRMQRLMGKDVPPYDPRGLVSWVTPLKHDHAAGEPVSVPGKDPEVVDAAGVVCHDCGRELVSDLGAERILVCPRVHGRRPEAGNPLPKKEHGAVECGQPPDG